jgi:CTP:molybdopterin cytidylyltransferase MocA
MRATVEQGLSWVEQTFAPTAQDAWVLCPADHPALDAEVVRQLALVRQEHPGRSIFVPTFAGRRGHPTLLGWSHLAGIRGHTPGQGLNTYLRLQVELTLEVPVATAAVLGDLDTPEDYERLRKAFPGDPGMG